jgi:hypothetical protein
MNAIVKMPNTDRYARCVETSKRVRWDIEKDVIRGRRFDVAHKFLPDGLSLADAFTSLSADERRFVGQIQGRTYANVFGLVGRFINAKVLELSHDHWFGDQVALEALVRFSDEELKHQALFRRIDAMIGEAAVDGILQAQAKADARYFVTKCGRTVDDAEGRMIEAAFLKAYRWQYIHSGAQHPHFGKVLFSLITESQGQRIQAALNTLQ